MTFLYPWWLMALALLPLLWRFAQPSKIHLKDRFAPELYKKMVTPGGGLSQRVRRALFFGAMAFAIIALARPVIERGLITIESQSVNLIVGFDISHSMFADDIYPNRITFSKHKFYELLDHCQDERIGVVGFSSRAYLIAPPTRDYASLKYLVEHMGFDYVNLRGTDFMPVLEVSQKLLKKDHKKVLLLFTDGGDQNDFSQEIAYAKKHKIKLFIYAAATRKGGMIKTEHGPLKDDEGHIVITRLNPAVATLAKETGGAFLHFSLKEGDMRQLIQHIRHRLGKGDYQEQTIHDRKELFIYPLVAALLLLMIAWTSWPKKEKGAS